MSIAATARPKLSPVSAMPGTRPSPCRRSWVPVAERPVVAVPYSTLTAPVTKTEPIPSNGTPMARSVTASPSKSPESRDAPNSSKFSAVVPMSPSSWVNSWLPTPVRPSPVPDRVKTAPPRTTLFTDSSSEPTARSAKPSASKSAAASAPPDWSLIGRRRRRR
jgi:hypothetical protein